MGVLQRGVRAAVCPTRTQALPQSLPESLTFWLSGRMVVSLPGETTRLVRQRRPRARALRPSMGESSTVFCGRMGVSPPGETTLMAVRRHLPQEQALWLSLPEGITVLHCGPTAVSQPGDRTSTVTATTRGRQYRHRGRALWLSRPATSTVLPCGRMAVSRRGEAIDFRQATPPLEQASRVSPRAIPTVLPCERMGASHAGGMITPVSRPRHAGQVS